MGRAVRRYVRMVGWPAGFAAVTEAVCFDALEMSVFRDASVRVKSNASRMKQAAARMSRAVVMRVSRLRPRAAEPQKRARRLLVASHLYCKAKPVMVSSRM